MKQRTYVCVHARTEVDGTIIPEALVLEGRLIAVGRVLECRDARATKAGGSGMRYTVACGPTSLTLFLDEERRWFLEDEQHVRQIPCDH